MKILDTRTAQVKTISPIVRGHIKMYVCGPTVYSPPHLGHARNYIFFDTLAKYLEFKGFDVKYIQNITDMGKNIKKVSDQEGITLNEVVKRYEKEYLDAMQMLNVDSVDVYERSSDNIDIMISQIQRMLQNKHVYPLTNGVFYDTSGSVDFGSLSHLNKNELASVEEYSGKRSVQDFSLWKEDASWGIEMDSPFGKGRPHWHVLDTALAEKYFGGCIYDIHGAGMDCIYPHHESIRAILQSLSGKPEPVRHWIHVAPVNVDGEKMSKSSENYEEIPSLIKDYGSQAIRLYLLSKHFTAPIEFDRKDLKIWKDKADFIRNAADNLRSYYTRDDSSMYGEFSHYLSRFVSEMDNNMNTPKVVKTLESLSTQINHKKEIGEVGPNNGNNAARVFSVFDDILGLGMLKRGVVYGK